MLSIKAQLPRTSFPETLEPPEPMSPPLQNLTNMPPIRVMNTSLIFSAYSLLLSIYIFTSPLSAARLFGLDAGPVNIPFIHIFAGRNFALALATMAFYIMGMPQQMGMVFACCCVAGSVDTVVVGRVGKPGKGLGHGVGCVVMGCVAWALMSGGS